MQKMRTFVSNNTHTSRGGTGVSFLQIDNMSSRVMIPPTQLVWFQHFMTGSHKWVGDIWRHDKVVSQYIVRTSMDILEESWEDTGRNLDHQLGVVTAECITTSGYFGGLCGKEISKTHIGAIHCYWNESACYLDHPHVPLVLCGRFKGQIREKLFCQLLTFKMVGGCWIRTWHVWLTQ